MKLVLSHDLPHSPPKGYFLTKIFHPNIANNGEICVNTLKKDWSPRLGLRHVLTVVRCLPIELFPESALNEQAGKLLLENYQDYAKHARLYTGIHAKPKPEFRTRAISVSTMALNVGQSNLIVDQKIVTPDSALPLASQTTNGTKAHDQATPSVAAATDSGYAGTSGARGEFAGKRVLRDVWPIVSGTLTKPPMFIEDFGAGNGMFFVPQRPYTCIGTLRDQIIYPFSHKEAEQRIVELYGYDSGKNLDAHLKTILKNVRLNYLLERDESGWDANPNWEDILSLGEQQRLGMARLFFHKPKFGILDECTNATSVDVEEQLYRVGKDLGITVVTSSQRPALIPFHSLELRLIDGEGNWELRSIKQ